ncbi:MAG: DUF4363 family protein [Agathobaculum sp.]|uniref:DUF4363 family protein n=1 Tax=Agathobaculum sp. TaxID=2048138 RepID=UPI0025BD08F1|nr:DUF4363 family protein [Agathobaculum sp.]MCI7124968.1 DUF4363 family protein [Agathobaculum sp.]MDY3711256.1 DUF4363 family protein [Agathobaculum sp.]
MRRLLIAFVVLALLLWGSLWSSSTVERTVNEVVAALEADELEQAYALWMRAQSKFGALLLHDELDQANLLFARLRAAQAAGLEDDLRVDRAELLSQLRHLPELEKPSIMNLL